MLVAVEERWDDGSSCVDLGMGVEVRPLRDGRVVGGGDVDLLEVLVVEGAADLPDDRGAAAGGLEVGGHRVGQREGRADLAG